MAAVTVHSDSGAQENEIWHSFQCFCICLPWNDGADAMALFFEYWVLRQHDHSPLSPSSRCSYSSLLSAIKVVSFAYLRLLIFLLAILIPACESSGPAFYIMYSAYKLNKQIIYSLDVLLSQFWTRVLFLCPVLTIASCPTYRFIRRQIRWSGISIPLRIF